MARKMTRFKSATKAMKDLVKHTEHDIDMASGYAKLEIFEWIFEYFRVNYPFQFSVVINNYIEGGQNGEQEKDGK